MVWNLKSLLICRVSLYHFFLCSLLKKLGHLSCRVWYHLAFCCFSLCGVYLAQPSGLCIPHQFELDSGGEVCLGRWRSRSSAGLSVTCAAPESYRALRMSSRATRSPVCSPVGRQDRCLFLLPLFASFRPCSRSPRPAGQRVFVSRDTGLGCFFLSPRPSAPGSSSPSQWWPRPFSPGHLLPPPSTRPSSCCCVGPRGSQSGSASP